MISIIAMGYRAVERPIAERLRRFLAAHHETCPDWVEEIPEPMFRQLIQDSLLRTLVLFILWLTAVVAWSFADHPEIFWTKLVIGLLAVSIIMLINWRKLSTQCVDREFLYRRLNGKWRWER
jgi:hypothetical protein